MKILFFIESLRPGGKERRLVELIKNLLKDSNVKCELVLTKKEIHYKEIFKTGIKIHFIVRKYFKKDPRLFFMFYNITKQYQPDIIHVWGNLVAIYAIPAKLLLRIPIINNQIADAPIKISKGLLSHKLTFLFSDRIIANSISGLISYSAPTKNSSVIYNGFNFKRINTLESPTMIRDKFRIQTKYVIGMVASFSDRKDYYSFIKASISILKRRHDVTFLCIGSGDYRYYKDFFKLEKTKNLKFLGRQENVESIMNVCNIGVLTTITEGISNAIMEFMALGKPVIASEGGGTKELIVNNQTGYLIPYKSPKKLENKIILLLNNKTKREEFGKRGKKRIESEFSIKKMLKKFLIIYNETCKSKQ